MQDFRPCSRNTRGQVKQLLKEEARRILNEGTDPRAAEAFMRMQARAEEVVSLWDGVMRQFGCRPRSEEPDV